MNESQIHPEEWDGIFLRNVLLAIYYSTKQSKTCEPYEIF